MKKHIKTCNKCILPATYPGITFNENGVCSYCDVYENRWLNWKEKEKEFITILNKNQSGKYNAIVGFSGGKDSTFVLHKIVNDYGVKNILAFTYDNGFLSDGAKDNIQKTIKKLGIDYEYHKMPLKQERILYKKAIEKKSSELCMFCMNPTINTLIRLTKKYNTKTVIMGESPRTEPQFPLTMLNAFDYQFLKSVVGNENCEKSNSQYFKESKLLNSIKLFGTTKIKFINLPEYIDWNPFEIIELLKREYGWVDYGKGIPHFDCMLEPLIDHFMYKRLGYSKVVDNISILVRRGLLTREEALKKYEKEEVKEIPTFFIQEFCKRIGVEEKDFEPYLKGESLDYTHFKSNAAIIQKMSPLLKVLSTLGIIPDSIYRKYSI